MVIRVIPQVTVDNNLGPDGLASPMALDPNYCRHQPFDCRPLSELRLFGAMAFTPTPTINATHLS